MIIDERVSERDFGEFEGIPNTDFDFNAFWSYKQNLKYDKAENIKDFFRRVYDFLESIKNEYAGKRILIVAQLPLCLGNCEVAKYSYKELER